MLCLCCNKELRGKYQTKFCSRSCGTSYHEATRHPKRKCLVCFDLHRNPIFCSYDCSAVYFSAHRINKSGLSQEGRIERDRVANLVAVRRYQARRYAQTPADADEHQIREIYAHCPEGYEVDHVIPISKGGLHHQDNLQYLLMLDNRKKSNSITRR